MNLGKAFRHEPETIRERAAESLESAAKSIRDVGDETAGAIHDLADEAGEKLDTSACFVRSFAGGDMLGSLKASVRRKPVESLALAVAAGFLVSFACRRRCQLFCVNAIPVCGKTC